MMIKMEVKKEAWNNLRSEHVRHLLEAHDDVLLAYYGGLYGGAEGMVKNLIGHDIYDIRTMSRKSSIRSGLCVTLCL